MELDQTTSKTLYHTILQAILPTLQHEGECQAITQRLLAHYFHLDMVAVLLDTPLNISRTQAQLLHKAIARLQGHEPIQYVLGETWFMNRRFQVSPAVLIPRPETEALVQHIIQENPRAGSRVLDIGTGSGCIAITLQQELLHAIVAALDIDAAALRVAQANAEELGATVQWVQTDLLQEPLPAQRWDIMVSNPPYVRQSEQTTMQRQVLDYEPAKALFVPNDQPLVFYERIVSLAPQHLRPAGKLYLEINEAFGAAVADLLVGAGFGAVCVMQDLHGKDRWVQGLYVT